MSIITINALDGTPVSFENKVIAQGGMKDVYFSPEKSEVVAFFRDKQDQNTRDRLLAITTLYRERIFNQAGGEYWKKVFCWPTRVVEYNGMLGVVVPVYQPHFYFEFGSVENDKLGIKGKEKEGKWFASAFHRNGTLDTRERGHWLNYFRVCIQFCRAVRRMHAAGLAHSDLSYKNVLIDPCEGNSCIIDMDSLVVPNKYPPLVVGTPDFIAPEVMKTQYLPINDPRKFLPSRHTDQHALAILIYMYLLYRHPLRGRQFFDAEDSLRDEFLTMGENALFIEHPGDTRNRYSLEWLKTNQGRRWSYYIPWGDLDKLPYRVLGPYLGGLVEKAFIDGLHHPAVRPTADDWETALIKTVDLMHPCQNPECQQKWFVFDGNAPGCPFCGTPFKGQLPILHFYAQRGGETYLPDHFRLVVYHNLYMYPWHVNRNVFPDEQLTEIQRKSVGYFVFHQGAWHLVNQLLNGLKDLDEHKTIPPNSAVLLKNGQRLLFSAEDGGRMVQVQMVSI